VRALLAAAWDRDALTALKLVANLRGVRGTGKSDKDGFYAAALWMHERHPRTLACNIPALAEFGYFKDFPELLYRLIHGPDVRKVAKARADADKARRAMKVRVAKLAERRTRAHENYAAVVSATTIPSKPTLADYFTATLARTKSKSKRSRKAAAVAPVDTEEPDQAMEVEQEPEPEAMAVEQKPEAPQEAAPQQPQEEAAAKKKKATKKVPKAARLAVNALETYYSDRAYRFLFDCVAEFFADLLASDLKQLAPGGKKKKIGLAAKWCPTPDSSFDRTTLLCEAIARRLFPRDSSPDYADLSEEHYAYSVLHRLRREVLVPLRKVLELPEVYISAQRWSQLPYARVASVAMRRYKSLFKKHDDRRQGVPEASRVRLIH
jgi:hypothetical protein